MAESEEELKSLLVKVKEERETVDLKLNIQKMKIMVSGPMIDKEFSPERNFFLIFISLVEMDTILLHSFGIKVEITSPYI